MIDSCSDKSDDITSSARLPVSSSLRWLMKPLFPWMSVLPGCHRAWQWPRPLGGELNQPLSAWVAAWPAGLWGCYPAQEPRGVLWSVILDPELHRRRIRNPKDLGAPDREAVSCDWQPLSSAGDEEEVKKKVSHWSCCDDELNVHSLAATSTTLTHRGENLLKH